MRLLVTKKFTAFWLMAGIALAACSYNHGVMRFLTFDRDISDFSCLTNQLESSGYQVESSNASISYQPQSTGTYPSAIMSISIAEIANSDGTYKKDTYTLVHSADFGSGPAKCKIVKPAAKTLLHIEDTVFAACNLITVKKPEQHMSCG